MIKRDITKRLYTIAHKFPVVAVIGPRQSGKTTLVKAVFSNKPYVSLEDLDAREYAINDPRGFLSDYPKGAVLDEIQRAPQIFSYLQGIVDKYNKNGMFILTGSQHFLLQQNISQTLAGRVAILKLLPLSMKELFPTSYAFKEYEEYIFKGFYPRLYDKKLKPQEWYPNYIQTYIERDVRLVKNIGDLRTFHTFIKMCASRTAQLLNLSSIANDCGITHNTAKSWISILEASFIIFLLSPHYKNFNKRLIKMPKLYFYDTGLACSLLGIENKNQLMTHSIKGNLFEAFVLSEMLKSYYNQGIEPRFYFWRDKTGHEIDCIIEKAGRLTPIEIKCAKTATEDFFKHLTYWNKLSKNNPKNSYVIYGGNASQKRSLGNLISWKDINLLRCN